MVAPMVLAAGIGAAGSALGGVMGGKGAKKAAKTAAKSQEKITKMNNALVQGIYDSNAARLDPFIQGGTRAGNVLMELLLGPAPAGGGGGGGGMPATNSEWSRILSLQNDGIDGNFQSAARQFITANGGSLPQGYTGPTWDQVQTYDGDGITGNYDQGLLTLGGAIAGGMTPAAPPGATNAAGQPTSALSAWDQFKQGSMYQQRLQEGQKAINQGYASAGALDSGAARAALQEQGQLFASSELGNWMNMLAGQQGVGLQAGGALAGVGMNTVNAQMANNQNAANANSNAALISGQANQNMWGSIGQGIGQIAGAFGSSYGQPQSGAPNDIVMNYNHPAWAGGGMWG